MEDIFQNQPIYLDVKNGCFLCTPLSFFSLWLSLSGPMHFVTFLISEEGCWSAILTQKTAAVSPVWKATFKQTARSGPASVWTPSFLCLLCPIFSGAFSQASAIAWKCGTRTPSFQLNSSSDLSFQGMGLGLMVFSASLFLRRKNITWSQGKPGSVASQGQSYVKSLD